MSSLQFPDSNRLTVGKDAAGNASGEEESVCVYMNGSERYGDLCKVDIHPNFENAASPRAEPRGTQRPGGSECERSGRPCRTERAKLHCGAVCRALNAVHDVCGPTELPALLSTQSVRPSVRPR